MRWLALSAVLLLLLGACASDDELPPAPLPPGSETMAGKATAGLLQLASGTIPKWALPLENAEVTFTDKEIFVKVKKPAHVKGKFYIYTKSYFYDKPHRSWVENRAVLKDSGKLASVWNEDYAVFTALLNSPLFTPGSNYFVIFYCYEFLVGGEVKRDSKGYKVWGDCQKYHLGAFDIGGTYPDILIEKQIENELYKGSSKIDSADGTAYTATYEDRYNKAKTTVTVTKLDDVDDFRMAQAQKIADLTKLWAKDGNVCGFLKKDAGQVYFWWLSGDWLVKVITYANTIASDKIGNYGIKYQSDCNLLSKLKSIAGKAANVCGNGKVEPAEQCDTSDDSVCPEACKPDCTCALTGVGNTGFCGDYVVQDPNSKNVGEQCELPGEIDMVTGQLASSSCFVRDEGEITGVGACDGECQCDPTADVPKPVCNNKKADPGEQCGDPGTGLCKSNEVCINCGCVPIPSSCKHDGKVGAGESCDPTATQTGCHEGLACTATCVCADELVNCGNAKIDPGDQCEKSSECLISGLKGLCFGCNCWYFTEEQPVVEYCGDGKKQAGEGCESNADCSTGEKCHLESCACYKCGDSVKKGPEACDPPGSDCDLAGGTKGTCDKDCGCGPKVLSDCGDGKVVSPEQCDPPGAPTCIMSVGGGCNTVACQNDCTCPAGDKCPPGCPAEYCPPVDGLIKINAQRYGGFGVGTQYSQYGACWDACIGKANIPGTIIGDNALVAPNGYCYEVSGVSAIGGTPTVVTTSIIGYSYVCDGNNLVGYFPSGSPKKCVEQKKACPPNTVCTMTPLVAPGAKCAPALVPPTAVSICGNGVKEAGELCEKASECAPLANYNVVCINCACSYTPAQTSETTLGTYKWVQSVVVGTPPGVWCVSGTWPGQACATLGAQCLYSAAVTPQLKLTCTSQTAAPTERAVGTYRVVSGCYYIATSGGTICPAACPAGTGTNSPCYQIGHKCSTQGLSSAIGSVMECKA